MMLEVPVNLADRSEELKLEMNTAVERKNTPRCEVCQDNESRKCKESGTNYEGQPEKEAEKSSAAAKEEVESEFFKVGDLVDAQCSIQHVTKLQVESSPPNFIIQPHDTDLYLCQDCPFPGCPGP